MLVLTRLKGERIVMPSLGVTLVVSDLRGGKVWLGIDAPHEAPVHREEVWLRIQENERRRDTGA